MFVNRTHGVKYKFVTPQTKLWLSIYKKKYVAHVATRLQNGIEKASNICSCPLAVPSTQRRQSFYDNLIAVISVPFICDENIIWRESIVSCENVEDQHNDYQKNIIYFMKSSNKIPCHFIDKKQSAKLNKFIIFVIKTASISRFANVAVEIWCAQERLFDSRSIMRWSNNAVAHRTVLWKTMPGWQGC